MSQRKTFLIIAHDDSGHQGIDHTMARLSEMAYWVRMGKDIAHYCTHCFTCQVNKAPEQTTAPLQPVIATKSWELVAVDILKVPMSAEGISLYQLYHSGLFFKVAFCRALPEQKVKK